jgi:membrane-associated protease RseP (regulator of RpoE activity)
MNERPQFHQPESIDVEYKVKNETSNEVRSFGKKAPNPRINIILFIATLFTTTFAGALMEADPSVPFFSQFHKGLPFSLTLITILLFHEFGHYFTAKKHRVEATLPYFIPAPPPFLVGTFGAVIKMRSPLYSKKSLFDIGVTGPLAGVVVAVPAIIFGLRLSEIRAVSELRGGLALGSSLLFSFLSKITVGNVPDNHDIILHPIAFAGWFGLLVTMFNLLPVGQLDGGHIAYAVLGHYWHRKIASAILPLLLFLGILPIPQILFMLIIPSGMRDLEWVLYVQQWLEWLAGYGWIGWLIWYVLLRSVIKVVHPPTIDDALPLGKGRKLIGWIALVLFVLTFTPVPLRFIFME